jgi:hypothetical protein
MKPKLRYPSQLTNEEGKMLGLESTYGKVNHKDGAMIPEGAG